MFLIISQISLVYNELPRFLAITALCTKALLYIIIQRTYIYNSFAVSLYSFIQNKLALILYRHGFHLTITY